jgi:hypothetical protein
MSAIARRLEQIEKAAVVREPEIWISLIEPEADAPKSEWDDYRVRVAKAEAGGLNLIVLRII